MGSTPFQKSPWWVQPKKSLTRNKTPVRERTGAIFGTGQRADAGRRSGAAEDSVRSRDAEIARRTHYWRSGGGDRPHRTSRAGHGRTIEYFRDTVFNYPTLAEAYKVAALDGLNKL